MLVAPCSMDSALKTLSGFGRYQSTLYIDKSLQIIILYAGNDLCER